MWIDELYEHTVIAFGRDVVARLSDWMDRYFWDGLVRCLAESVSSSESSAKVLMSAASTPELMKLRPARAVWAV